MKKSIAVLIGSTGNEAFAVGNVVIGLRKHLLQNLANDDYDIIFYTDKLEKADENALKKIYENIDIRIYENPLLKYKSKIRDALHYSIFTYVRFEAFNMLDMYKQVFYVDTDIVIEKDISELIGNENIFSISYYDSTLHEYLKGDTKILFSKYDMNSAPFNAGVFLVSDAFPNYKEVANWLYSKAMEYKINDEIALNLLVREFNVKPNDWTKKYNSFYVVNSESAIIHSLGPKKFWRGRHNDTWEQNNKIWLSYGGLNNLDTTANKRKLVSKILWFIPFSKLRHRLKDVILNKMGLSGR